MIISLVWSSECCLMIKNISSRAMFFRYACSNTKKLNTKANSSHFPNFSPHHQLSHGRYKKQRSNGTRFHFWVFCRRRALKTFIKWVSLFIVFVVVKSLDCIKFFFLGLIISIFASSSLPFFFPPSSEIIKLNQGMEI